MVRYDLDFIFLHISSLLSMILFFFILKIKNKKQIHNVFSLFLLLVCIWNLTLLVEKYLYYLIKYNGEFFAYLSYIIIIILPIVLLFMAIIFNQTKIVFESKYLFMCILPILDLILLITNPFHHLFFIASSPDGSYIDGLLFNYHLVITYTYSFFSMGLLVFYAIKNAGFFSKQAILICIGSLLPIGANVLENFIYIGQFASPSTFSITVIFYMLAIFKFQFLNVSPIALEKVVDHISDSFIVVNEDYEIIDFNKTFVKTFGSYIQLKRKDNLIEYFGTIQSLNIVPEAIERYIILAIKTKESHTYEKHYVSVDGEFDKYFEIEVTPIMSSEVFIGILVLFRDITQHKENEEKIKQTQNQLMERERLASLGEIAGGVAHDINSPLSSVQTILYSINKSTEKIKEFFETNQIEADELLPEIESIEKRLQNGNTACERIAKIVNSVRNHTRNLSGEDNQDFYIMNVLEDIKILINHQLKSSGCELALAEVQRFLIKGDPGKLGQVLTNLIVNAIQAYGDNPGKIEAKVSKNGNNAIIAVSDQAGGISEMFREGIFSKILTTKGVQGTGLGLYLSYSIITGHFGGNITFESEEGKGTTFFVSIPIN